LFLAGKIGPGIRLGSPARGPLDDARRFFVTEDTVNIFQRLGYALYASKVRIVRARRHGIDPAAGAATPVTLQHEPEAAELLRLKARV
jgi:hypothetical protein